MKFGKQIQNQTIPEWASHYMSYKGLKKIINSLENLQTGDQKSFSVTISALPPPNAENESSPTIDKAGSNLKALKTSFFYKVERELEKVNTFYLTKEAELKVRLRSLMDKKRIIKDGTMGISSVKSLRDAFLHLQKDLEKLQHFVEVNATGFRKILKKWDKRSKSSTKELYLSRQVEIQPCFNREVLTELTDVISANITELMQMAENSTEHIVTPPADFAEKVQPPPNILSLPHAHSDSLDDLESELLKSVTLNSVRRVQEALCKTSSNSRAVEIISRVFIRACAESSLECIRLLVDTEKVDYTYVDDISDRTCLHEAAIAGRLDVMELIVNHDVNLEAVDVYGRLPLHYVAMHGHSEAAVFLLQRHCQVDIADHDGFSPLFYAITGGHTKLVETLIDAGASIEANPQSHYNPLSLACQYGHLDIATLLLSKGVAVISNADGLHPLHLTSREGHHELSRLLTQHGADVDVLDKFNSWSPIFYAASEGHLECVKVLLDAGCKVDLVDETSWTAITHAIYRGHISTANLLAAKSNLHPFITPSASTTSAVSSPLPGDTPSESIGSKRSPSLVSGGPVSKRQATITPIAPSELFTSKFADAESEMSDLDLDSIPSLSLPPPIIPFRIYGHNFLDKKYQIQVSLGHASFDFSVARPPITILNARPVSSLKLIISSKPDTGSIPFSVILPISDDREVFTFQVDNIDDFAVQFDVFPTYGTKAIGRAVSLPTVFNSSGGESGKKTRVIVPLFDMALQVMGELAFEFSVITPFAHTRLQVGGQVETYWKSTKVIAPSKSTVNAITSSPVFTQIHNPPPVLSFITASSLAEQYLHVTVQVTRDLVPVIFPTWYLPIDIVDVSVMDITFQQFLEVGKKFKKEKGVSDDWFCVGMGGEGDTRLAKRMNESFLTLEEVLKTSPPHIGLNIEIKFPSVSETQFYHLPTTLEINQTVDAVLKTVYDYSQSLVSSNDGNTNASTQRSLIFSSFNPGVCTAVNWKQPNYAVFFNSYCGYPSPSSATTKFDLNALNQTSSASTLKLDQAPSMLIDQPKPTEQLNSGRIQKGSGYKGPDEFKEDDVRCNSIKEAIRFAKGNNLLGVMCEATPLVQVPTLLQTIKESGLILATFGELNNFSEYIKLQEKYGVDAIYQDGVLKYISGR
ncbi:hypothetical protein BKA69DRAFT_1052414 [Paraphysoderma sedebokerense]|nr:hypothetical protein BKA69DRAFT_1052414 [Paraphysoderma sedebokerense]